MTNERLSELRHKGYITNDEYNELKQKVGRWIKRESGIVFFECSVCKDGYIDQPTCMGKPMFKYCPNCGASMVEPQERSK